MLRCMAKICGNLLEEIKLLIKPLCHRYFSPRQFSCSKSAIKTLEQDVEYVQKSTVKTPKQHQ